jgi:predicted transcriptional regulator
MDAIREPETVGELMTHDPVLAVADMSLVDAAELMDFYRVGDLPVIDWGNNLIGVIGWTDLLVVRRTQALWQALPVLAVRDVMTQPAATVKSNDAIAVAARLMERMHIHRLVVIDIDDGSPIGVLSMNDLVPSMVELDASYASPGRVARGKRPFGPADWTSRSAPSIGKR